MWMSKSCTQTICLCTVSANSEVFVTASVNVDKPFVLFLRERVKSNGQKMYTDSQYAELLTALGPYLVVRCHFSLSELSHCCVV